MIERRDHDYVYHRVGDHLIQFEVSDEDTAGDPMYFGYLSQEGAWLIQQRTAGTGAYRYCIGTTDYKDAVTGAWALRATHTYVYFDAL